MIYINEMFGGFGDFFPDVYISTSVADFLREKNKIKPPSLLKFLNPLMWFQGRLAYIKFTNVNLEPESRLLFDHYRVSDLSGEFIIHAPEPEWAYHESARSKNICFGRQYELAVLLWYWPDKGRLELVRTKKYGPKEPAISSSDVSNLELQLCPSKQH